MNLTQALRESGQATLRNKGEEWRAFFGVPQFAKNIEGDVPLLLYIEHRFWINAQAEEWGPWCANAALSAEAAISNHWESTLIPDVVENNSAKSKKLKIPVMDVHDCYRCPFRSTGYRPHCQLSGVEISYCVKVPFGCPLRGGPVQVQLHKDHR